MSFYFIENKNPLDDPNIDLDFTNDALYGTLIGDELDKYNIPYANDGVIPDRPVRNTIQKRQNKKSKTNNKNNKQTESSYFNISVVFIIIVIIIIFLWYVFGGKNKTKSVPIVETYNSEPELIMLSPDFGTGFRYIK
jgi:hypothetical protein